MSDPQENVLTDHSYDGIQEYDNPMPGWWVWMFILSIVFAFPYWAWFHLADGHSMIDEYDSSIAAAEALAPKLDESAEAMLAYQSDPEILGRGQAVFVAKCASCHVADGGGLVGPNMCDDNYINVKTIGDILPLVRDGVLEKGMPAHKGLLRQQQIVQVSAFAASLRGTQPANPREAQGDPIPAWQ